MFRSSFLANAEQQKEVPAISFFSQFGTRLRKRLGALSLGSKAARLALLCGLASLPAGALSAAHAEEMTFNVVRLGDPSMCGYRCPTVIAANGEITNRTPAAFVDFLQHSGRGVHSIVLLNSPGGKVVASMQLGSIMRRLGAAAVVAQADPSAPGSLLAGRCFSACVYALIGGRKRVIPLNSEVGIHRMFAYEPGRGLSGMFGERYRRLDDGGMRSVLSRYSGKMGVSPQLIYSAERVMPDNIHIVSRAEIARWHLGTSHF
jgi:hypothetical protein